MNFAENVQKLMQSRDLLDAVINAAVENGAVVAGGNVGTDDPMTSPLTPEGAWVPPYLAQAIRLTLRQNPELYGPEEHDFASNRKIRRPIRFPRALVLNKLHRRTDLTEPQANFIQLANPASFVFALANGGSILNHQPLDAPLTGGYLAVVANVYDDNLELLERHVIDYFRRNCGTVFEDEA